MAVTIPEEFLDLAEKRSIISLATLMADGRVLVFELVATGKYGWDLFSRAYEQMLNSIVIGDSAAATAEATAEAAG